MSGVGVGEGGYIEGGWGREWGPHCCVQKCKEAKWMDGLIVNMDRTLWQFVFQISLTHTLIFDGSYNLHSAHLLPSHQPIFFYICVFVVYSYSYIKLIVCVS